MFATLFLFAARFAQVKVIEADPVASAVPANDTGASGAELVRLLVAATVVPASVVAVTVKVLVPAPRLAASAVNVVAGGSTVLAVPFTVTV
jgi:hypothetical protein